MGSNARTALARIRVVDLSQVGAGPYLASLLGDLGADVVKVEPPEGESLRRIDDDFGPNASSYFFGINRSKRAMTIDLKEDSGREVFYRLVSKADVLIVSMRPRVLHRLKIDYETLSRLNPRLIYCAITAFGETGPRADEPGMDILAQALGGVMGLTGEPDRPPVRVGPPIADFATSFIGGFAICAALYERERSRVGQKVSLNLLDTTIALLANFVTPFFKNHVPIRPAGNGHPQLVPYQVFPAADGYIVVACLSDRFWAPLCAAIGRPDLSADPRFSTNSDRVGHRETLVPLLTEVFAQRDMDHWLRALKEHDVPCSPVHRLEDVFDDPQTVHNEMLLSLDHPEYGKYLATANPVRMSRTPPLPHGHAPSVGEHNGELLRDLGYSEAEVSALLTGACRVAQPQAAAVEGSVL